MLIEAFQYKQWSDRRTLDAIERIDEQKFPSAVAFAAQQLNHMIIVEELFRARLLGEPDPHLSTNTETVPKLPEIVQRIADSNLWFSGYAENLDSQHLNHLVSFRFADGKQGSMTRLEILFHIINHGTYHRGAIGHALDLSQVSHPADTYTVFIHATEPERRGLPRAE
ncbi:damage-inducible protein DinB [Cupriavidus necator]|uniref:Damage-inducible protein DinB n=1 Tax=Cupriavidus necator TaxID=106590 RepID=A0A1U9V0R8_CUPNE|nr:DinB family protein [Cupriavidus necator]AQV98409.1 damage-inducible protein DinB [Cupriavidus necator]